MAKLSRVNSSIIDSLKRRIVKVLGLGKSDVQTSYEMSPFGIDSSPNKNMVALHMETSAKGDTVIVGYINKNAISNPGETRLFATDSSGNESAFVYLKNSGEVSVDGSKVVVEANTFIEIAGNTDNFVKFNPLSAAFLNQQALINAELAKIATGIAAAGGAYTPIPLNLDINGAKVDKVKTS